MRMEGESWERLAAEFARIGRILFQGGLNNSHSGNLSVRLGDKLVITRRGAMLGGLSPDDLVPGGLKRDDSGIALASTEVKVHRAIYLSTSALAVVHTHPRSATALSLNGDSIVPVDVEGRYYFKRVPVFTAGKAIGSEELEKGLQISHSLEWSCDILLRCLAMGLSPEALMGDDMHGEW